MLFSQYQGIEVFFGICALIGGAFVLLRIVTQLIGIDHGDSGNFDAGGHDFDSHHADSDVGFKILSLHGLTAFLMMFGLVGLALYRQSGMGTFISISGAIVAGLASVWIIKKLFYVIVNLQSSGTIAIDSTVGAQGKVYTTIPENGTGRVLITVNNSLREYDAASQDTHAIATATPIRVVWVDGNILVVERI